jgi:hypothetical protein
MPTNESRYYNPANGQEIDDQMDFWAQSVVIDNRTSSYIEVVPARRWIDPGSGAGIPFKATQKAQLRWTAPPGKTQIPPVAGEVAQVRFYTNPYPPGIGLVTKQAISGLTTNIAAKEIDRQITGGLAGSVSIPANNVTIQSLGTFNHIRVFIRAQSTGAVASDTLQLRLNADAATDYWYGFIRGFNVNVQEGNNAAAAVTQFGLGQDWPTSANDVHFGTMVLDLFDINSLTPHMIVFRAGFMEQGLLLVAAHVEGYGLHTPASTVIAQLTFSFQGGSFANGSVFSTFGL